MVIAICIGKNEDYTGKITSYTLIDLEDNRSCVTGLQIKNAIKAGKIKILNMELSASGRLIEKKLTKTEQVLIDIYKDIYDLNYTDRFEDYVHCEENIKGKIRRYFGFNPWR